MIKEITVGYEEGSSSVVQKICTCDCLCGGALGIGESYCSGKGVAAKEAF